METSLVASTPHWIVALRESSVLASSERFRPLEKGEVPRLVLEGVPGSHSLPVLFRY